MALNQIKVFIGMLNVEHPILVKHGDCVGDGHRALALDGCAEEVRCALVSRLLVQHGALRSLGLDG